MASQFDAFRDNPLSGDERYSRERKIRCGYDNAARLKAADDDLLSAGKMVSTTAPEFWARLKEAARIDDIGGRGEKKGESNSPTV